MSTVTWQSNQRRPQLSLPARCVYVRGLFDQNLKVAEIIEKLDAFACNAVELQWIIDNKKGNVQKWAKKEIADLDILTT